ncbi:MAG TPA: Tol-Pal system beta propeller repeat protein TolB [Gallionellaceae bacterium]|nr:Tol-Pal system beta propeller repeat protein TolB [Gallionellaceae bacterium]
MKRSAVLRYASFLFLLGLTLPARAELTIEITGAGEHQIPIAVVPFAGEEKSAQNISSVVSADLLRSGLFRLVNVTGKTPHQPSEVTFADWAGTDALAIGSVTEQTNGRMAVQFRLLDVVRQTELLGQSVSAKGSQLRAIAHRIADMIFEKLTGTRGVFSTRIAYVNRQTGSYRLVVADSDGYGEQTVLSSVEPIMSPAWSPDGSHLAYVSFEKRHAVVYVQSLLTGQRLLLANFEGSNSAPAWSLDGRQLAIVLSRDGSSQIYLIRPDGSGLHRISFSEAIDTEPCFSSDGQFLLFTSDRGGSPQIYQMSTDGIGTAERLTFEEGNNFSPRYSPDGKSFTYTHLVNGSFYIAVQDFATQQMQMLTGGGWEKRPSFAPNGKMVLFANEAQGRGILSTVSSDGRVKQKMFPQSGDIREPTWGPFLNSNFN